MILGFFYIVFYFIYIVLHLLHLYYTQILFAFVMYKSIELSNSDFSQNENEDIFPK